MSTRTAIVCVAIGLLLAVVIAFAGTAALVYFEVQP